MPREFDIPAFFRSPLISEIKKRRRDSDSMKRDVAPTSIQLGRLELKLARHFGFCFGVENAIQIAYQALRSNPDKRVYLLSEMIHNAHVNNDLARRGVRFLFSTCGDVLIELSELTADDIVIVPAFGTTVEMFEQLRSRGIEPLKYNATCPFVEKVWRRAEQLGKQGFSVVIHGKPSHEETRATFSHAQQGAPSVVIFDRNEAKLLAAYIVGAEAFESFASKFGNRVSSGFNPELHLQRVGVVNQTTMLASETHEISKIIQQAMCQRFGEDMLSEHFADTRDTLCYATNENQDAVLRLVQEQADFAIVVGGYNSSNTSHLAELLEKSFPTYYVQDADELMSIEEIKHLDLALQRVTVSRGWLPAAPKPITAVLTAGASCPDALVEQVIERLALLVGAEVVI